MSTPERKDISDLAGIMAAAPGAKETGNTSFGINT